MNDFFVNLHGWLKEQGALIGTLVIIGILTLVMHSYGTPATYLGIAILLAAAPFLSYAAWAKLKLQMSWHAKLQATSDEQARHQQEVIDELRVKLHGASITNAQLNQIVNALKESEQKSAARITDFEQAEAEKLTRIEDLETRLQSMREAEVFRDGWANGLQNELKKHRQLNRALHIFLASVYNSGTRQENYLDELVWFLYVDVPGSQVRFAVPELGEETNPYNKDTKTYVDFLKKLPPYEQAWDGHLPTMVFDRLNELAGKLYDTRLSPPIALASTGKAPTKARVAKKRARGSNT
jgi:hypothetical protein